MWYLRRVNMYRVNPWGVRCVKFSWSTDQWDEIKWDKMKVGSCGAGLSLWDVATFAYQRNETGNEINFWGIYFCYKILNPTFHGPPGRACIFFSHFFFFFFIKENREVGQKECWRGFHSWQFQSQKLHFIYICHLPSGACVGTICVQTPTHMYV